jgi:predicted methyltransferase
MLGVLMRPLTRRWLAYPLALRLAVLPLLACGGAAAPSVPPQLVVPVAPDAASQAPAHCPKATTDAPAAPPAPTPTAMVRPPVVEIPVSPAIQAMVDAADRDPEDKKLDAGRHPGELLAFLGLKAGDRVAELAAGGG